MGKRPIAIRDILSTALPGRVAGRLPPPALLAAWRETAGERIAQRASPVCLEASGILVVAVSSPVWRQEISLLAPSLAAKLRERGQEVTSLKLVLAQTPPPPPMETPPRELEPEEERRITELVEEVEDPGLRRSLRSLMRAQLSWRRDPGR